MGDIIYIAVVACYQKEFIIFMRNLLKENADISVNATEVMVDTKQSERVSFIYVPDADRTRGVRFKHYIDITFFHPDTRKVFKERGEAIFSLNQRGAKKIAEKDLSNIFLIIKPL